MSSPADQSPDHDAAAEQQEQDLAPGTQGLREDLKATLQPLVLDVQARASLSHSPEPDPLTPLIPSRAFLEEQALSRKIDPTAALGASLCLLLFTIMSIVSWESSREMFVATQAKVFQQGEWWRLLTSPFVHADFFHLLSNAMLFLIFATLLNNYFGRWAFPVLSVLGAAATEAIALLTYPPDVRLVGASGMVYLMVGMWLVYFARNSSYLKLSQRLMRVTAFVLVVLLPSTIEPQVSYRSHAIGFALGVFLAWMSLPWVKPKPLDRDAYSRAQAKVLSRRRFLEEEDDVLTYLALRAHPNSQSLPENEEQPRNPVL